MSAYQQIKVIIHSAIQQICFEVSRHRTQIPGKYIKIIWKNIYDDVYYQQIKNWDQKNDLSLSTLITLVLNKCYQLNFKEIQEKLSNQTQNNLISFQEFMEILIQLYPFIEGRFSQPKLRTIFRLIDTNNDGSIDNIQMLNLVESILPKNNKNSSPSRKSIPTSRFSYSETANKIRNNLLKILSKFDKDSDGYLDKQNILSVLKQVLHETQSEIQYAMALIFNKQSSRSISLKHMTDFLLQKHCGQMSIQRLHSMKLYQNWASRIMSYQQFSKTLGTALGYFYSQIDQNELVQLFQQADANEDGFISYKEYFQFLKQFFGSSSNSAENQAVQKFQGQLMNATAQKLSHIQVTDNKAAVSVLESIFKESNQQIQFAQKNLLKLVIDPSTMSQKQMKKMLTFLHMGIIMLLRGHKTKAFKKWRSFQLSCKQFVDLIIDATQWAQISADTSTLNFVFNQLDTNKDKAISYKQYLGFIKQSIGNKTSKQVQEYLISLFIDQQQGQKINSTQALKQIIWNAFKTIYINKLLPGEKVMDFQKIQKIISELIKSQNAQQDYVRWNYSRIDRNNDNKIDLEQFVSFIIPYSAEMALQRFHMKVGKGKNDLTMNEFINLVKQAFIYIVQSKNWNNLLSRIFNEIKENNVVSYKTFLAWIKKDIGS